MEKLLSFKIMLSTQLFRSCYLTGTFLFGKVSKKDTQGFIAAGDRTASLQRYNTSTILQTYRT